MSFPDNKPEDSGAAFAVAFCQDCGRSLTPETRRNVGDQVFCEPCLAQRLHGSAPAAGGFNATPYANVPPASGFASGFTPGTASGAPPAAEPATAAPPPAGMPPYAVPAWYNQLPKPVIAALLGLIPGVGAMYNGQFAKGIAHIVIFAVLNSMTHVSDSFDILVFGWIVYQAFDAYHTANARRLGLPLPDPFGLNNIGERLGFHKGPGSGWDSQHWDRATSNQASAAAAYPPQPAPIVTPPPAGSDYTASAESYAAPAAVPVYPPATEPAWPAASAAYDVQPVINSYVNDRLNSGIASGSAAPYGSTTMPYTAVAEPGLAEGPPPFVATQRTLPASAFWLIGLGVLFLVMTLSHNRFDMMDIMPFILAALAAWIFARHVWFGPVARTLGAQTPIAARAMQAALWPGLLLTVAILQELQFHSSFGFDRSWPILLIVIGSLVMLRRAAPYATTADAAADQAAGFGTTR